MRKLANLETPLKLDIGCGHSKIEGYVGMDSLDFGQEIVWNINDGIPLPDNSVSALHSSHFAEHLKKEELPNFFSEMVRVGINGAPIVLIAPHSETIQAHYLCHYSYWNEDVVKGIVEDSPNIELKEVCRGANGADKVNLIAELIIRK